MSLLAVRFPQGPDGPALWFTAGSDGAVTGSGRIDPPFSGQLAEHVSGRAVLLLPGDSVVAHSAHLPAAGAAQTRAAARFAIEDELSVEPDSVHLAIGPAGAAGAPRAIWVVGRDVLEAHLRAARALGLSPDEALPEWAALPAGPGEASALVLEDAHVRAGAWGFSAEPQFASYILDRALDRLDLGRVRIWGDPAAIAPQEGWGRREIETHAADPDAVFAEGLSAGAPLNLLQGAFAPRRSGSFDLLVWRRAAVLAVGAILLWLGLTMAEAAALNRRADALNREAETVFASAFPEVGRIVNPRLQMQNELAGLRGRGGGAFLDLAALLAASVAAQDEMEIASLRYAGEDGALQAEIVYSDYSALQALGEAIAQGGGVLEEGASRQTAGRVSADITVRIP